MDSNFLKTDEFATLCGTTRDTLHLYDKMGLLKPQFRGENGYRFYHSAQYLEFELIHTLKASGSRLREIQAYFKMTDLKSQLEFFKTKQKDLQEQLAQMERQLALIDSINTSLQEAAVCSIDAPEVITLPEERLLLTPIPEKANQVDTLDDDSLRAHIMKAANRTGGQQYPHGVILSGENLENITFCSHFYIWDEGDADSFRPAGSYIRYYVQGDYNRLPEAIQTVLKYMREHGMKVAGDAYVYDLITSLVCGSQDKMILKILVPIA